MLGCVFDTHRHGQLKHATCHGQESVYADYKRPGMKHQKGLLGIAW